MAAAVGDLEMMTALLNGEYDDGAAWACAQCHSYADQDFLAPRGVHIAASQLVGSRWSATTRRW